MWKRSPEKNNCCTTSVCGATSSHFSLISRIYLKNPKYRQQKIISPPDPELALFFKKTYLFKF